MTEGPTDFTDIDGNKQFKPFGIDFAHWNTTSSQYLVRTVCMGKWGKQETDYPNGCCSWRSRRHGYHTQNTSQRGGFIGGYLQESPGICHNVFLHMRSLSVLHACTSKTALGMVKKRLQFMYQAHRSRVFKSWTPMTNNKGCEAVRLISWLADLIFDQPRIYRVYYVRLQLPEQSIIINDS